MTRVEFTKAVINLLAGMFLEGENPIIDYVKRSDEEQMRLFIQKKSQCDGVKKISRHQIGRAVDIYFIDEKTNQLCEPKKGFEFWHKYWERKGGNPEISWDRNHFEV